MSFRASVAGWEGSSGAIELVLSPLCIGFPIVLIEEDPVIAVPAEPAVRFYLEDRFLSTGNGVRRWRKISGIKMSDPFLARQLFR